MEDYPSNSHASRSGNQGEKKMEPVPIEGKIAVKKKNSIGAFIHGLVVDDAKSLRDYVIGELLLPRARRLIFDVIAGAAAKALGQDTKQTISEPEPYRRYYGQSQGTKTNQSRYAYEGSPFDWNRLIFETKRDASLVLSRMQDVIELYDVVSINDMYDIAEFDREGFPSTWADYGWRSLKGSTIEHGRNGYFIRFPRPKPL